MHISNWNEIMSHLDWVLYFDSPPRICDALPPLFSKERGASACGRGG
jgi:hypothetical protein